jgi:hypothetical protein
MSALKTGDYPDFLNQCISEELNLIRRRARACHFLNQAIQWITLLLLTQIPQLQPRYGLHKHSVDTDKENFLELMPLLPVYSGIFNS